MLIALFERAVGYYASLVNINAYHQPGVEAGKKAAGNVLAIQRAIIAFLKSNSSKPFTAAEIAKAIGKEDDTEIIFKVCEHLAANKVRKIRKRSVTNVFESRFKMV
jgi:glucose-6-phosphate isomerase